MPQVQRSVTLNLRPEGYGSLLRVNPGSSGLCSLGPAAPFRPKEHRETVC